MALMRSIVLLGVLIQLAFAATIQRRDWSTVRSDLESIDATLKKSQTDCLNYDGRGTAVITFIIIDLNNYINGVRNGTRDCQNTVATSVTAAQATSINNYLNSPFEPDNRALMNCIINQNQIKNTPGPANVMRTQLNYIQGNTTIFHSCLKTKTPTAQKAATSSLTAKIDANIQRAVAAYAV